MSDLSVGELHFCMLVLNNCVPIVLSKLLNLSDPPLASFC